MVVGGVVVVVVVVVVVEFRKFNASSIIRFANVGEFVAVVGGVSLAI